MTRPLPTDPLGQNLYNFNYEALYGILGILPDPLEQTPEGFARRNTAVVEQISHLVPASAAEATLAGMVVAGLAYWSDCMTQARAARNDDKQEDRLTRQAARVGRETRGYLASLLRLQGERQRREATEAGAFKADCIQENCRELMLTALDHPPKPRLPETPPAPPPCPAPSADAEVQAAPPEPAPPPLQPLAAPAAAPAEAAPPAGEEPAQQPAQVLRLLPVPRVVPPPGSARSPARPKDEDWPEPDWQQEAELYAIMYPDRARLFRRLGRLPTPCDFGPPEPELLRAIVTGATPQLLKLDLPDEAAEQRLRRYA